MDTVNQLRACIDRALRPSEGILKAALPAQGVCADAAQFDQRAIFPRAIQNSAEWLVLGRLSHIPVNPSTPLRSEVICKSYVYPPSAPERDQDRRVVVNRSPQATEAFLQSLIEVAQYEREASLVDDDIRRAAQMRDVQRVFLLIGQRGVGKTFFLNYVLSRYSELLDKEKVIWVRINLVERNGFDHNLTNWIYAQIAKIVLRYYDQNSSYKRHSGLPRHDFYGHLREWLQTSVADRAEYYDMKQRLDLMRDVFCEFGKDRSIDPDLCNPRLCLELYTHCRRLGYSFLIILDGFDRLDADRVHVERFLVLRSHIVTLIGTPAKFGAAFVIALRDVTLSYVNSNSADPFHKIDSESGFSISSVPFEAMLDARLKAIASEIETVGRNNPDYRRRNWPVVLQDFQNWLHSNHDEFRLDYMELANDVNNRSKMQIVQLYFQQFLSQTMGIGYQLLEQMVKCGSDYPPIIYEFSQSPNGLQIHVIGKAPYDSRLLPVLTRPPLIKDGAGEYPVSNYRNTSILHGMRILQILESHRVLNRGHQEFEYRLTIDALANFLHAALDYAPFKTMAFIDLLECYDVLRTGADETADMSSPYRDLVGLKKASFIIDTAIRDVAYLNLCAMRTVIGHHPASSTSLFRAARLEGKDLPELRHWIKVKISNAMALSKLLSTLNEIEEAKWQERAANYAFSEAAAPIFKHALQNGFFTLTDKIQKSVELEITRIWETLSNTKSTILSAEALAEEIQYRAEILERL